MRGEVISVLSLEGRYHNRSRNRNRNRNRNRSGPLTAGGRRLQLFISEECLS